jgi:hypothetical protein
MATATRRQRRPTGAQEGCELTSGAFGVAIARTNDGKEVRELQAAREAGRADDLLDARGMLSVRGPG